MGDCIGASPNTGPTGLARLKLKLCERTYFRSTDNGEAKFRSNYYQVLPKETRGHGVRTTKCCKSRG
eukprot:2282046-Rhodomonas_salina.1